MRTAVFDSDPLIGRAREAIENSRQILLEFYRLKSELDERMNRASLIGLDLLNVKNRLNGGVHSEFPE